MLRNLIDYIRMQPYHRQQLKRIKSQAAYDRQVLLTVKKARAR